MGRIGLVGLIGLAGAVGVMAWRTGLLRQAAGVVGWGILLAWAGLDGLWRRLRRGR